VRTANHRPIAVPRRNQASVLGRVVFALSPASSYSSSKPPGAGRLDDVQVTYEGPALFEGARLPVDGYYE
jgi:hypothetical protein